MKAEQSISDTLDSALTALPPGPIAVAFSGGLDSATLLHALSRLPAARERGLRAIQIDHGLHAQSGTWTAHCEQICLACEVPLLSLRVSVERSSGLGLEAAARQARFDAFKSTLAEGEFLALAQHRDDQVETVLLKLLRGAGPEGLGGMRNLRRLGTAWAWRPLLDTPRAALRRYAEHAELEWVEDPSNIDTRFERNFLRHEVLPQLRDRWSRADQSICQSAEWIRAAADFIDEQAQRALARLQGLDPATLNYRDWLGLSDALRDPVLRRWLRYLHLPEPNQHQLGELERQLADAGEDKLPCVRWPGAEVRRYRDLIYAMKTQVLPDPDWQCAWDGQPLSLPADLGSLYLQPATRSNQDPAIAEPLKVRFRRGGERLRLDAGGYHRELRHLLQEAGVPPWQRGCIPIVLNRKDELLAVGDLFLSDVGRQQFARLDRTLCWIRDPG
ncbi:MAG TPA: tRNA lysidine(34) synthetase TilS [Dokdonella sp.]|uniref:tRNA lysidine(34) synthetase TilS n=1 Tax=Dokdonella sp. TaxID=2291710 RepID=UPI002D800E2A|nr:tRNA lysidine(34) synthetase TilS [Dokdonella sp.]HET9033304.1 tRNA lysidine(34) synthetase TilS [Dokdonella sp.]